jgi:hypothetical protein
VNADTAVLLLADRERSKTHVIVAREREPLLRGCFILMVVMYGGVVVKICVP